jgi:type II secretory pathway pseudopilin PulG
MQRLQMAKTKPTEKGLTLIEALAAIVIFGLSITAVTSPLMLSMATRVRAHRAQQAMQLAQGEIDRVRLLLERGDINDDLVDLLPPDDGGTVPAADVGAPTGQDAACEPAADEVNQWCLVEVNNDEFAVQTFRTKTQPLSEENTTPAGFVMGVRVYTKAAIDNNGTVGTEPISLAFSAANTSSPGPLVAIYTPIVRSDLPNSASIYNALLQ